MSLQANVTTGVKRKLSIEDDTDMSNTDTTLVDDSTQLSGNPAKRHTESQRAQDPTPLDELAPDDDGNSSDSQYEFTLIDDEANDTTTPYIPITSNRIATKHISHPSPEHDEDDDLINKPEQKDSALDLAWSDDDDCISAYESDAPIPPASAWFPDPISTESKQNESMQYDKSAYNVLFEFHTEWPCLSFDILRDTLGAMRTTVPYSLYLVCGTQADPNYRNIHTPNSRHNSKKNVRCDNKLHILKLNELQKTKYDDDADGENEEKDADYVHMTDDEPVLQNRDIIHPSSVNRIRAFNTPNQRHLVSTFGEDCCVYIWDITQHVLSLDGLADNLDMVNTTHKPLMQSKHSDEGFGLAWHSNGVKLLTGSCAGELRMYQEKNGAFVRSMQFKTLKASIEDVQWSPQHSELFVSVGVDKCIRLWDCRCAKREHAARIQNAHTQDINVCSWNKHSGHEHLLLTGSDDHSFKVWDLRKLHNNKGQFGKKLKKCAHYYMSSWHTAPITAIEWHPNDASCAVVSSEDDQVSMWDFSLEEDAAAVNTGAQLPDGKGKVPPQLVFVHAGQKDVKEVHWHPQIPNLCVSTGGEGFHVFQPDNLMESLKEQFQNMSIVD